MDSKLEKVIAQINVWLENSNDAEEFVRLSMPSKLLEQGSTAEDFHKFIDQTQILGRTMAGVYSGYALRGLLLQEQFSHDLSWLKDSERQTYIDGIINFLEAGYDLWSLDLSSCENL